jgi:hypothetical protein
MKYRQEIEKFPAAGYAQNTQSQVVIMAYKNKLFALALLAISPLSAAQDWNGTVLGFEARRSLCWAICSAFVKSSR